ncbi:DNA-binding SARP family transcriptional activator [Haloactinopolyspora alba]|uniref:DNA-binding SARP family transcriptional activator n=1 Tax=Haloactinopolyspora alba TaxID=648780 RepID=A0A2P8E5N4_9ACTN|nr:BTAD domain-containing putative transcriptional regulator [Haloactinopolyspora alba]PSL04761.1 DNA-binding SARP family transcriptional activator [Haloactinopolyspora alba]
MHAAGRGSDHHPIEIALLGPVEVRSRGVPAAVPTGRPRTLLACLALSPGQAVTQATLAGYLWPEGLPAHPRQALQTYVARLRSVLGADAVATAQDGFALDLPRRAVDLHRFRTAVADADAAADDPAEQLRQLCEALSLWQGAPLSGLSPATLTTEHSAALTAERLDVTERANELRLRLNDVGDELIGTLRRLVAQHPWRERSWSQLMRALYAGGRPGEALATFHELVGVLRRDLGTDPGPELTELHQRMLAADSGLVSASAPPAGRAVPVPAQLPAGVSDFVGRAGEVASMTTLLSDTEGPARRIVVSGAAGTGKTTLALRVAHRVRCAYPDGQLFADLRGASDPAAAHDVLGQFLRALGVTGSAVPPTLDERGTLFRSLCERRRLLIMLDDVGSADQVAPLVTTDRCAVLVTARPHLPSLPADQRIDLDVFSPAEAGELLTAIVGRARLATEPDATADVLASCGGSPLAVRIAGARLTTRASWSVEQLARQLSTNTGLAALSVDGMSVRATLDVTHRSLEPEQARWFRLLAAMPATACDTESASVVWGVDPAAARAGLEHLSHLRLLEPADEHGYVWHDLVGQYMAELADAAELQRPAAALLRRAHLNLRNAKRCLRAERELRDAVDDDPDAAHARAFAGAAEVHEWLHPRLEAIRSLARRGLEGAHGLPVDEAAAVMMLSDIVASECCLSDTAGDAARAVLDADVPLPAGLSAVGAAWQNLGAALATQHRFDDALAAGERAIAVWRELGDRFRELSTLGNMATAYARSGRHLEAADLLATCIAADDVLPAQGRARCLQNMASVHVRLGRYAEADRALRDAHALAPPDPVSPDSYYEALRWAELHRETDRRDDAVAAYDRAHGIGVALDSSHMQATALRYCARALRQVGDDGSAPAAQALEIARLNHHLRLEADALVELGHAADKLGNPGVATSYWRQAVEILESLGAPDAGDVRQLLTD